MEIFHDHSYITQAEREFISRGYACESLYSLRFSYMLTEAQKAENHAYSEAVGLDSDAWNAHAAASARQRSEHMERIANLLAQNFKVYQYGEDESVPYKSDWDMFFWCNDFTLRELSGRDYGYFTLAFNDKHDHERRQKVYNRAMRMLDKKALRKFATDNPAPAILPGHGLLHAPQVDYIVRTAVRIIGHRRTLVLYVYDREQAAGGDSRPVWTMFQAGEDHITMARRKDGSTHWREAVFENLGEDYRFTSDCAFYSVQDERHVCDFFRDHDHGGIAALVRAQQAILDKRRQERQCRRERRTIDRMRPLRALPRGLEGWIRREVMPAYFRCGHTSVRRPVTGICTSCGKEATLPSAAHNSETTVPTASES